MSAASEQVRAVVLPAFGAELDVRTFPRLAPRAGATVELGGVCGADMHLQDGRMAIPTPLVLGYKAVGRVRSLGDGVTADANGVPLAPGDLLGWASNIPCGTCFFCVQERERSLCERRTVYGINQSADTWPHLSGGWADEIYLQPGSTVVKLPEGTTVSRSSRWAVPGPRWCTDCSRSLLPAWGTSSSSRAPDRSAWRPRCMPTSRERPRSSWSVARRGGWSWPSISARATWLSTSSRSRTPPSARRGCWPRPRPAVAKTSLESTGAPHAVGEGLDLCRKNGWYLVVGQYTDHGAVPLNPHLITASS